VGYVMACSGVDVSHETKQEQNVVVCMFPLRFLFWRRFTFKRRRAPARLTPPPGDVGASQTRYNPRKIPSSESRAKTKNAHSHHQ
jgi:hypothetical protein